MDWDWDPNSKSVILIKLTLVGGGGLIVPALFSDGYFSMKKGVQNFVTFLNSFRAFRKSKKNLVFHSVLW